MPTLPSRHGCAATHSVTLDVGLRLCGLSPVTSTTPIAASLPWHAPIGESRSTTRHPAVEQSLGEAIATWNSPHFLPSEGMNA